MDKPRCYFVIDMKSFFASVECVERGLDAKKARLVVADISRTEKTICLAVSTQMRALGIKNRCRFFELPKHLDFIVAPPRMKKYISYAAKIYRLYLKYISKDDIYQYSIDECFIDVTDYLKIYNMRAKDFAKKLIDEIYEKIGIPASCGIGTNMYLAKCALDIMAKKSPDMIGYLTEKTFKKELWYHTPITDFWGISKGTANRLKKYAIYDMHGIAVCNEDFLYDEFGIKAEILIDHANGLEPTTIEDVKKYKARSKSFSISQILPGPYSYEDSLIIVNEMVVECCFRLCKEHLEAKSIHLSLGYQDELGFFTKGSRRLLEPSSLITDILPVALELYERITDKKKEVRRIAVALTDLREEEGLSVNLFKDIEKTKKEKKLINTVLDIKDKYGKNAILRAIDFEEKATGRERNMQVGGHKGGED